MAGIHWCSRYWYRMDGRVVVPQREVGVRGTWVVVALVAGVLAVSGCGSTIPHAKDSGVDAGLALAPGGLTDKGFNDMSNSGLDRAKHRRGVDSTLVRVPLDGTEREQKLKELVAHKDNPVIAVGPEYADSLAAVAKANPKKTFAIVNSEQPTAPNIVNIGFAEEQGSYLMGIAAARKSQTRHVGFVGGVKDAVTGRYQAGFVAGVRSVDPGATIDIGYLAPDPTKAMNANNSPNLARTVAVGMLTKGADVIYHAAGNSGIGVFDAVVSARASTGSKTLWAIGSDTDQYLTATVAQQRVMLTSMVKRADNAVYHFISDYLDGKVKPGLHRYSFAERSLAYATAGNNVSKFAPELDAAKAAIIAGRIQVPTVP